jgi:hypothetical protein
MFVNGYFAEKKIINGKTIEDVELHETINGNKKIVEGQINGKPIHIVKSLLRQNTNTKKIKTAKNKKNKRKTNKKAKTQTKK